MIVDNNFKVTYDLSADERIRETIRQREKAFFDYRADIKHAMDEGEAKGMVKGRAEGLAEDEAKGRAEVIANMRANGFTEEQIKLALGI